MSLPAKPLHPVLPNVTEYPDVHCTWLAESINKYVEEMVARGGLSPSSGLMCEIVNSVGQGNFTFVRKKSGNFKNP